MPKRSPFPLGRPPSIPVLRRSNSPASQNKVRMESLVDSISGLHLLDAPEQHVHESAQAAEGQSAIIPTDPGTELGLPMSSSHLITSYAGLEEIQQNVVNEERNIEFHGTQAAPTEVSDRPHPPYARDHLLDSSGPTTFQEGLKDVLDDQWVEGQMRTTGAATVKQDKMATRQRSSIGNGNRVRGISSRPIIGRPTPTSAQKSGTRADARRVSPQRPPGSRRVRLEGSPVDIICEDAPWEDKPGGETTVAEFVRARVQDRRALWSVLQLALADAVPDDKLFRSSRRGRSFALRPESCSHPPVPLQRVHVGTGTIPNSLADIPCTQMATTDLLNELNSVIGTKYMLQIRGCQDLLEHVRTTARDFGEAYGILRPWWSHPSTALQDMERLKHEISELRKGAIQESWIYNSLVPPQRVWDLYSNRVLPFHTLPQAFHTSVSIPYNLWTVSHSWAADDDRVEVSTNINGQRWPVPIPRETTLDHVRIELLNMGAEYVWLDVLCLRQRGSDADEETRKEEWKLDVPTIGYIYQAQPRHRPCIVYFNGLGLPFATSPELLESDRHWFNRVWTLQESLETWLPGGLTGKPLAGGRDFFNRLDALVRSISSADRRSDVMRDLARRSCTNELDKISALAYYLGCRTLPLYDESLSVESAWALLIKHMPGKERTRTFVKYPVDSPFAPCTSWSGFLQPAFPLSSLRSTRVFFSGVSEVHITNEGRFTHCGWMIGPCGIRREPRKDVTGGVDSPLSPMIRLDFERDFVCFIPAEIHGVFLRDISYFLVRVSEETREHWVVVEIAERGSQEPELDAIKWGVIGVSDDDGKAIEELFVDLEDARVVYLDSEEARRRSALAERYMEAFTEMRAKGDTVTFGE